MTQLLAAPTVSIGGKPYPLAPMSFFTMKKIWPQLAVMQDFDEEDPAQSAPAMDAISAVMVALLNQNDAPDAEPTWTVDKFDRALGFGEVAALKDAIVQVVDASGLVKAGAPGGARAAK